MGGNNGNLLPNTPFHGEEEPMDANSGEPWSEMDIADLTHSLDFGDTFAQTASFLCKDEDEVRQKAQYVAAKRL